MSTLTSIRTRIVWRNVVLVTVMGCAANALTQCLFWACGFHFTGAFVGFLAGPFVVFVGTLFTGSRFLVLRDLTDKEAQ